MLGALWPRERIAFRRNLESNAERVVSIGPKKPHQKTNGRGKAAPVYRKLDAIIINKIHTAYNRNLQQSALC